MLQLDNAVVYHGSNLDVLPTLPDNSVDSIVTDPPYELGFMGKSWDSSGIAYSVELWTECMRVLKPGGHLLAFSGSRTYHRMVVAIEDAGFEIRDMVSWISNKTFPKSHNISIAIDKQSGATGHRGKMFSVGHNTSGVKNLPNAHAVDDHQPITDEAKQWQGWGTGLKPTVEPIVMARKPLIGTVAQNVLTYGTGGLNIDASRIGTEQVTINTFDNGAKPFGDAVGEPFTSRQSTGRWPANVIFDEVAANLLDEQSEIIKSGAASRFFYVARASKADRNQGVNNNRHPTVKPTSLMEYLIKLVTPEGGTVLDPFTGSGSTGKAALLNGFQFIGIELTEEYLPIIEGRLRWANKQYQAEPEGLF